MCEIKKRLADLKAKQEKGEYTLCPRCGRDTMKPKLYTNALSRLADIMICDECGQAEALLAVMNNEGTIYKWAALQPVCPKHNFKKLPCEKVLTKVGKEQEAMLYALEEECQDLSNYEEIRYKAFQQLQGLKEFWPRPFTVEYYAADGAVNFSIKRTAKGKDLLGYIVHK